MLSAAGNAGKQLSILPVYAKSSKNCYIYAICPIQWDAPKRTCSNAQDFWRVKVN